MIRIRSSKAKLLGVRTFRCGVWKAGDDFELIPTIKVETRHPVEIYFGREFPAICYHCGVLAAWGRHNWNISRNFCVFWKNDPLWENIQNSVQKSLHRDTDRRCCMQNSWKLSPKSVQFRQSDSRPREGRQNAPYSISNTRRSYSFSPSKNVRNNLAISLPMSPLL